MSPTLHFIYVRYFTSRIAVLFVTRKFHVSPLADMQLFRWNLQITLFFHSLNWNGSVPFDEDVTTLVKKWH